MKWLFAIAAVAGLAAGWVQTLSAEDGGERWPAASSSDWSGLWASIEARLANEAEAGRAGVSGGDGDRAGVWAPLARALDRDGGERSEDAKRVEGAEPTRAASASGARTFEAEAGRITVYDDDGEEPAPAPGGAPGMAEDGEGPAGEGAGGESAGGESAGAESAGNLSERIEVYGEGALSGEPSGQGEADEGEGDGDAAAKGDSEAPAEDPADVINLEDPEDLADLEALGELAEGEVRQIETSEGSLAIYAEGTEAAPSGGGIVRVAGEGADARSRAPTAPGDSATDPHRTRACPREAHLADAETGEPLACYREAASATRLLDAEAMRLCEFAPSSAPVECYEHASRETNLLDAQKVDLCRCASSTRPVDCALEAKRDTLLNQAQILQLCRATHLERLYGDCRPIDKSAPRRDPAFEAYR